MKENSLNVVQIRRLPSATQFSVERYFNGIQSQISRFVSVTSCHVPALSRGLIGRVWNMLSAWTLRADVYHVTGDINYVTLLLPRKRTILTILDCQVLSRLIGWRRWVVKLLWFGIPARRVTRITAISHSTKEALLREVRFPADRIHVIPVCVSSQFQPDPRRFNQCCPRVLQIGTKPNKNVVRLVKSLAGLEVELDIVGPIDAELMAALEDTKLRYQSFGRLSDEEILERYREADIVAFVSTEEGFGMPIVEAQCIERVCVTSNCSSMPEVAGAGACLVDPLDTQSIRAGFLRVIRDAVYREQLIAAGRENRTRFDAERIARQYSELYHLVFLESRSGRHLA